MYFWLIEGADEGNSEIRKPEDFKMFIIPVFTNTYKYRFTVHFDLNLLNREQKVQVCDATGA